MKLEVLTIKPGTRPQTIQDNAVQSMSLNEALEAITSKYSVKKEDAKLMLHEDEGNNMLDIYWMLEDEVVFIRVT